MSIRDDKLLVGNSICQGQWLLTSITSWLLSYAMTYKSTRSPMELEAGEKWDHRADAKSLSSFEIAQGEKETLSWLQLEAIIYF